jgi:hypothetical protein
VTFILSVATRDAVYQVCDRRLTAFNGPTPGKPTTDDSNKATLVDGRMAFGYTGIARIRGVDSDKWFTHARANVSSMDLGVIVERIREKATREFAEMRKQHPAEWLTHAFVGIGWANYKNEPLAPMYVTISNAIKADGTWAHTPSDNFRVELDRWGKKHNGFAAASAGVTLEAGEGGAIWQHIQPEFRKRGSSHLALLGKMIDAVRWVAERHTEVGRGVLALCIPKTAAIHALQGKGMIMLTGGAPTAEAATFYYLAADDQRLVAYGPHMVTAGSSATGFRVTPAAL